MGQSIDVRRLYKIFIIPNGLIVVNGKNMSMQFTGIHRINHIACDAHFICSVYVLVYFYSNIKRENRIRSQYIATGLQNVFAEHMVSIGIVRK